MRHDLILRVIAKLLIPFILLFALYVISGGVRIEGDLVSETAAAVKEIEEEVEEAVWEERTRSWGFGGGEGGGEIDSEHARGFHTTNTTTRR